MKYFYHFIIRLFQNIIGLVLVVMVAYGVLAVCNWKTDPLDWNLFSQFLICVVILIMIIATYDALSNTITNIKNERSRKSN